MIRVPFFLLFGFNKGTPKEKGQKGTTGAPSLRVAIRFYERCRVPAGFKTSLCARALRKLDKNP